MHYLQIIFVFLCLQLALTDRLYSDYIDDISQEEIRFRPMAESVHPNFYRPLPKPTRKPKPDMPATTEKLCEKNLRKKKEQEALENPQKEYKPSGNRWHGSVSYGSDQQKNRRLSSRSTKVRYITPKDRNSHKCYKWIKSDEFSRYEWAAVIRNNTVEKDGVLIKSSVLIEICCPQFGPVRVMGNTLCKPYCHSCRNGKCVAPEVCQYHDGFVLSDNRDCVFTCPISCLNGRCNLLLRGCLCNPGYTLDESGEFCRPICRNGCGLNPLHNCTAPDTCGCVRGYTLTDNDCQPVFHRG